MKTTKNYLYKSVEMSRESRSLQLLQKDFCFLGLLILFLWML